MLTQSCSTLSSISLSLMLNTVLKAPGTLSFIHTDDYIDVLPDHGDLETLIASLHFIFKSAARFDVNTDTLNNELQQLGLPKGEALAPEHTAVCNDASALNRTLHVTLQGIRREYTWTASCFGDAELETYC